MARPRGRERGLSRLSGQRVTPQRKLLFNLMREARGHLDAAELYRRAREMEPRLSLATVYRNIRLFKKLGLIEEWHFDENHHHYEAKGITEHYHLICLGCGRVLEFQSPLAKRIKEEVSLEKGFTITGAEFHLEGYCPRCRTKTATE